LTVRAATREDEPEIIRLLHLMHAEGGLFTLDLDRARETFAQAFDRKGGIIGVIGPSDNIEAMIGLMISRMWYTTEDNISEYFNFVRPDKRQTNHARELIAFAKRCSDHIGPPLMIGVLTNQDVLAKVRLYRRLLGDPVGAFFLYGAKWVNGASNDGMWETPLPTHARGETPRWIRRRERRRRK
jgi:hypothetical protein